MEFRLLYEGELLPSGGTNSRAPEKHSIRRAFHPQLRRLWSMRPELRTLAENAYISSLKGGQPPPEILSKDGGERFELGINAIGEEWNRAGYDLVPLVTPQMTARCHLDILILRPSDRQFIFKQGDLDGQLKTLFDALRIPSSLGEAGGIGPQDDETPLYCLLEDDRLISEVKVTSDELLLLPHEKQLRPNDSFVVIHVRLNHQFPRFWDNYFG